MTATLLERALAEGNPVITGDKATLVWRGAQPPFLIGDFNGWDLDHPAAWHAEARGLWSAALDLPGDAYMEYAFFTGKGDRDRIPDPLNSRAASNGCGAANHWFYMPEGRPTPLARPRRGSARGEVSQHRVKQSFLLANGRRDIWLYRPPVAGPAPLLVVYDGRDYLRRGKITAIVDNLIAQRRIRPIALALCDHGGPARGVEYACSEATLGFLFGTVLPLPRQHLDLVDPAQQPGAYGIAGASMGGLMALYTGLRMSTIFGRVLSQSGAFDLGEGESIISLLVRHAPAAPLKVWLDVGRFEGLLPANRALHALLVKHGYDAAYHEYNAGHNYPAWRDDLWRGLERLFPA